MAETKLGRDIISDTKHMHVGANTSKHPAW